MGSQSREPKGVSPASSWFHGLSGQQVGPKRQTREMRVGRGRGSGPDSAAPAYT